MATFVTLLFPPLRLRLRDLLLVAEYSEWVRQLAVHAVFVPAHLEFHPSSDWVRPAPRR